MVIRDNLLNEPNRGKYEEEEEEEVDKQRNNLATMSGNDNEQHNDVAPQLLPPALPLYGSFAQAWLIGKTAYKAIKSPN